MEDDCRWVVCAQRSNAIAAVMGLIFAVCDGRRREVAKNTEAFPTLNPLFESCLLYKYPRIVPSLVLAAQSFY